MSRDAGEIQDLHIGVRVGGESATRQHPTLVDDPQYGMPHPVRTIVVTERKTVASIQPTKVDMASLCCGSPFHHGVPLIYDTVAY